MASSFQLLLGGSPASEDLYTQMTSIEVEEHADLPGAIQLSLPVSATSAGDLTFINDNTLKAFANIAVVATVDGRADECIFDGFVLSHKLHVRTGTTASTLHVWGQDASWLMNLAEKAKEWADVTDADVASSIFNDYGITPSSDNSQEDSPSHTEDGHTLMQRGTDIQFLRSLGRRNGKLVRVACADKPGQRTGYFSKPNLDGDPAVTLKLNDPENWNVDSLDFEWDVARPSKVKARQALFNDASEDGVSGDASESGLGALADRGLADFAGRDITVLLTAPVDDAGELSLRSKAVLRDAGWFVRCEGETDVARLNAVLRVGALVQIAGIGSLNSGKYYVWSVRHTITPDSHKMKFVLVRNAVGPTPAGGGGLLGGLL
jgi:phage protein D